MVGYIQIECVTYDHAKSLSQELIGILVKKGNIQNYNNLKLCFSTENVY